MSNNKPNSTISDQIKSNAIINPSLVKTTNIDPVLPKLETAEVKSNIPNTSKYIKPAIIVVGILGILGIGVAGFSLLSGNSIKSTVATDNSVYTEYNKSIADFSVLFQLDGIKSFGDQAPVYNKFLEVAPYSHKEFDKIANVQLKTSTDPKNKSIYDLLTSRKTKAIEVNEATKKVETDINCALPILTKIDENTKSLKTQVANKPKDEAGQIDLAKKLMPTQKIINQLSSTVFACSTDASKTKTIESVNKIINSINKNIDKALATNDVAEFKKVYAVITAQSKQVKDVNPFKFLTNSISTNLQPKFTELTDLNKQIQNKVDELNKK